MAQRAGRGYFDVLHYKFDVSLNDSTNVILVESDISIAFSDEIKKTITFDLDGYSKSSGYGMIIRELEIDEIAVTYTHNAGEITINLASETSKLDTVNLHLVYSGIPANGLIISENKYGERTFFADHWPNRAHYWLPVIDHPSEKATCEFMVTAPRKYKVVSNGNLLSEKSVGNADKTTHWRETKPIPAKVMVIGVADFMTESIDSQFFSTAWVYAKTGRNGFYDFSDAAEIYDIISEQLGAYPFSKLDHVESTTGFGGMENAGNIFYDEKLVKGTKSFNAIIAHEIGHQWFGNSATESGWEDVWLSEGFATYVENHYIEKKYGKDSLQGVLRKDERKIRMYEAKYPKKVVLQKGYEDLKEILNPLTYEKGAWVLRMLAHEVGEESFWKILRTYYEKYKYGNASTPDFIAVAQEVSGKNLRPFFYQWLEVPGGLMIEYSTKYRKGKLEIIIKQLTNHTYDQTFDVLIGSETRTIRVYQKEQKIIIDNLDEEPTLTFDPQNIVYGRFIANR